MCVSMAAMNSNMPQYCLRDAMKRENISVLLLGEFIVASGDPTKSNLQDDKVALLAFEGGEVRGRDVRHYFGVNEIRGRAVAFVNKIFLYLGW